MEIYERNSYVYIGEYKYMIDKTGDGYYLNPRENCDVSTLQRIFMRGKLVNKKIFSNFLEPIIDKRVNCEVTARFPTLEDISLIIHIFKAIVEDNLSPEDAIRKVKYNDEVEVWTNF